MSSSKIFALQILAILLTLNCYTTAEICAGCPIKSDPNNPEIKQQLSKVLASQNSDDKVVRVISVTTQVVSGVLYRVEFEVKNPRTQEVKLCETSYLSQPWITKKLEVESFSCNPEQRQDRQSLGAKKDIDPSEKEMVTQLAEMAVKTLDDIDTDNSKRVVAEIIDAKKQLVNGIMYYLSLRVKSTSCSENGNPDSNCLHEETLPQEICKIQIHRSFADRSPLNAKVVKSECDEHNSILGAPVEASVESEQIVEAATFAANHISDMSNSIYKQILVRILEATSQIVSGIKMDLKLELGNTDCMKNMHKQTECTTVSRNSEKMICRVSVWSRPWKKVSGKSSMRITSFNCGPFYRTKRSFAGGVTVLDPNDKKVTSLKNFIEDELTARSNSQYTKRVVHVLNATTQVVSGTLTWVVVEIADTNCLKSENKEKSQCSATEQGIQICELAIWEQPWLNKKEISQSECHSKQNVHGRRKRMAELLGTDENDADLKSFHNFMERERKLYKDNEEVVRRFRIFKANMMKAAFLQKHEQGTAIYGASVFADLTAEEFKKYLGYKPNPDFKARLERKMAVIPNITLPKEFDWRHYNVVTGVKNQGLCGSCWAFSVTGNIEGLWAIQNKQLLSFSEQELVDCDKYDKGCLGGDFDTAYQAIEDMGGLETESDYPYKGYPGSCHFNKSEIKVSISGGLNISHNEEDMAKFLVKNGPFSIALNANAMQFYLGGVSHPIRFLCSPADLDHGVLIVGFGVHRTRFTHKNLPYWLIKNSWGTHWGNQGYYMLYRGDGSCGVNQAPTTAEL